jgi:glucokinase
MYLAGDIGGTNTRLALFERGGAGVIRRAVEVHPSGEHETLEAIVDLFRAAHDAPVDGATFAIAGPVIDGACQATNLPWRVEAASLATDLDLETVGLVNDLAANAIGVEVLPASDTLLVQAGRPAAGNEVVISPGTGLGEAGVVRVGGRRIAVACEGGHADFAPRNETEIDLLRFLQGRYDRVSYERIVSGPGLVNVYEFLCDTGKATPAPAVAEAMSSPQASPARITGAALAGECVLCEQALEIFLAALGAEAGNLALKYLATGGVWIGGGIMAAIGPRVDLAPLREAFAHKGRFRAMLEAAPVRVILDPHAALIGAAWHAMGQA